MENKIPGEIKERRSQKLIELSDVNEDNYNKKYIGKEVEILFEEEKNGVFQGHTNNYILGKLKVNNNIEKEKIENNIIKVKCIDIGKECIIVE